MIPAFSLTASAASFSGSGGTGIESNPYLIANLDDLEEFREYINGGNGSGEYFKLTVSIDMSANYNAENSTSWTPIGNETNQFKGTFDGGGLEISGLYVTSGAYVGLFGQSYGTIKNLTVKGSVADNASVGGASVGGIVGKNCGVISGCLSAVNITSGSTRVGGIVGQNDGGTIKNCYNTGTVRGGSYVGGIMGVSYSNLGPLDEPTVIENCYNAGAVSGNTVGGISGHTYGGDISNCYYLNTCGGSGDYGGTSITADVFKSGEVTWLLQNGQDEQVWGQTLGDESDEYPVLTTDSSQKVCKVIFATQDNPNYDVKYTNLNKTVTLPKNPSKTNYTFERWSQSEDADGEKFDASTSVTGDMTVYAVGRDHFGGESDEISLNLTYGEGKTLDLSEYMTYANESDTKGKFTYTIESGGSASCVIDGDTLTIPKELAAGDYTLTIKAAEKSPYALMSVENYGTEDVTLTVKVSIAKAESSVTSAPTAKDLTYNGAAQELVTAGEAEGGEMQYNTDGESYSAAVPTGTNAGTYTVWYKAAGDGNHNDTEPVKIENIKIEKAAAAANVTANDLTYTGSEQELVTGETTDGTLQYSTDGENYSAAVPKGTNAGTYTVWYKVVGDANHNDSEPSSIEVTIKKVAATASVWANELVFKDREQYLVTGKTDDGTLMYSTSENGEYSKKIPTGKDAGDYTVWYKVIGDSNHTDSAPQSITVSIKELVGISIEHEPTKTTIIEGMPFDASGLVVIADCGNGDTFEARGYTLSGYDTTTPLMETAEFYGGKRVIISCATEGADIYYTTDGTNPTASSQKYTAPIELTASAEIKAIAVKSGMNDSAVSDKAVTVEKVEAPVASVTGEVAVGMTVKLLCATPGAEIYYTFGDSLEEDNYKKYTGDIIITGSMTIRAMAAKRGCAMSDAVTFTYTVAPSEDEPSETNRALLDAGESACKAGRTFRLPAYVYSEKAITDFRYTLSFDSEKFEYVGLEAGDDVPVSDVSVTVAENSVTVRGTVNNLTAAEACVLVFKAKSDVEVDGYVLPVSDIEINTADDSLTEIWYLEGYVTIIPEDTYIFADAYLTDAEDNILEYMEDVKGDLTAYILAQPAEKPEDGETISCDLILAFYDTDGALFMVNTTEAELSDNMNYFEEPITIPENTEIGDVKLMVWDKIGTMKPLTEVTPVVYPYGNDLGE